MRIGILRRLQFGMMIFGIAMGLIFPLYAMFFVDFRPGMQIWFNTGCIIAGIMVGGFSYLLVKIILLRYLRRLALACREIAVGHLDVKIDLSSPDEIGEIISGFNMMVGTVHELLAEVKNGVRNLGAVAENLSAFSHELVEAVGEQRGNVTNISAATNEAAVTINEISENLSMTVGLSEEISNNANQTDEQISLSVKAMNKSSESLGKTLKRIEELGIQSKEIASILSIISEIAQQTNLLSLNATVEAARAGKHGKGFAVVAGEVKSLATRTAKATQEIEGRLGAFQGSVDQIINGIKENAELYAMLGDMLQMSTSRINHIIQNIGKVFRMIEQVSEATKQQVDAYHDIDISMGSITQAFNDMLESTDDLAQNGDDILKFAGHLQTIMKKFDKEEQLRLAA